MSILSTRSRQLLDALQRRIAMVETLSCLDHRQEDRRGCTRYETVLQSIQVLVVPRDQPAQSATLIDVSVDGVRLVMDSPPQCGEVVRLSFDFGDTQVELNGEVRHQGGGEAVGHVGLQFTDALVGPAAPVRETED